jgi:hypothetical protein
VRATDGWSTSRVPDQIYSEQERLYAADEAAKIRAVARGEVAPEPGDTMQQNAARPAEGAGRAHSPGGSK